MMLFKKFLLILLLLLFFNILINKVTLAQPAPEIPQIQRNNGLQLGKGSIKSVLLDETNERIIVHWSGNLVEFFDINWQKSIKLLPIDSDIKKVLLSKNDKYLAVITSKGIFVIDSKTMSISKKIAYNEIESSYSFNFGNRITISNDRLFIYQKDRYKFLTFDLERGKLVSILSLSEEPVNVINPNDKNIPWIFDPYAYKLIHIKNNCIYQYDLTEDDPKPVLLTKALKELQAPYNCRLLAYFSQKHKIIFSDEPGDYGYAPEIFSYDIKTGKIIKLVRLKSSKYNKNIEFKRTDNFILFSRSYDTVQYEKEGPYHRLMQEFTYDSESDKINEGKTSKHFSLTQHFTLNSNFAYLLINDEILCYNLKQNSVTIKKIKLDNPGDIYWIENVSSDNKRIVLLQTTDFYNRKILIYDLENSQKEFQVSVNCYTSIARFPNRSDNLLAFENSEEIFYFDPQTSKFTEEKRYAEISFNENSRLSDDLSTIVSNYYSVKENRVYLLVSKKEPLYKEKQRIKISGSMKSMALSPNGKRLVIMYPQKNSQSRLDIYEDRDGSFKKVKEWMVEIPKDRRFFRFIDNNQLLNCSDRAPKEFYILSLDESKVEKFDIHNYEESHEFFRVVKPYWGIGSPPPMFAIFFSRTGRFRIWDIDSKKIIADSKEDKKLDRFSRIHSMVFSHDGRFLAVSGKSSKEKNLNTIVIFDIKNQCNPIKTINPDSPAILSSFSPDNKIIAAEGDGFIVLRKMSIL